MSMFGDDPTRAEVCFYEGGQPQFAYAWSRTGRIQDLQRARDFLDKLLQIEIAAAKERSDG